MGHEQRTGEKQISIKIVFAPLQCKKTNTKKLKINYTFFDFLLDSGVYLCVSSKASDSISFLKVNIIQMPLSDSINRSKFFVEVFSINQKFTFAQMLDAIKIGESHFNIGTPSEKYAKKILFQFTDLSNSLNNLELIPTFFSINKVPSFYLKNGISEIDYYKYHLENHYIKISSTIDFSSNFINEVYRLGIPIRKCNVYTILENLNTKDTESAICLRKFERHFEKQKRIRNIIIHEGKHESEEIKSIDSNIMSTVFLGKEKLLTDYFNSQKQLAVSKVIDRIRQDNTDVSNFIKDIIESLTKPFLDNYNFLKSLEKVKRD